jgi:hypothetical protein
MQANLKKQIVQADIRQVGKNKLERFSAYAALQDGYPNKEMEAHFSYPFLTLA